MLNKKTSVATTEHSINRMFCCSVFCGGIGSLGELSIESLMKVILTQLKIVFTLKATEEGKANQFDQYGFTRVLGNRFKIYLRIS